MGEIQFRTSPYRWVVLAAVMLVNLTIQVLWISYAPVLTSAAGFYRVSEMAVGFFSMSFMLMFIPLSVPASWLIDRFGFYAAVGLGSAVTALFGVLRGLAGDSFPLAMLATLGIAAAQPLLLNAWTKMPAAWFPQSERATAVGLTTLSGIVGVALGMVLSPGLSDGLGIPHLQFAYGIVSAIAAVAFLALAREKPKCPPDESASMERALMLDGLKRALGLPSFRLYLLLAFIGMGVFNGVTTWVDAIAEPRGIDQATAGDLGAIMLIAGVLGAIVVPALSDRKGRRRAYIAGGLACAVPGLLGLAFASGVVPIGISCALLGFSLVAVSPVGMQYASEIARPTPEGSSNGLVSLAGQASVLLVWAMEALNGAAGNFAPSLLLCAVLLGLSAFLALRLVEPVRA